MFRNKKSALPGLLVTVGVLFGLAAPASAAGTGPVTGWEAPEEYPVPVPANGGQCGAPQSGFAFKSATFFLREAPAPAGGFRLVEVKIGEFRAAPQGAAPGRCAAPPAGMITPIVPAAVSIMSAKVGGDPCTLDGINDAYTRINTSVVITFNCAGAEWRLVGNQDICKVPDPLEVGYGDETLNPECLAANTAVYPDPVPGGAASHFVLTHTT